MRKSLKTTKAENNRQQETPLIRGVSHEIYYRYTSISIKLCYSIPIKEDTHAETIVKHEQVVLFTARGTAPYQPDI